MYIWRALCFVFIFIFRLASAMCTKSNIHLHLVLKCTNIWYICKMHSTHNMLWQNHIFPAHWLTNILALLQTPRDCESNRLHRRTACGRWRWQIADVNRRLLSKSPKGMEFIDSNAWTMMVLAKGFNPWESKFTAASKQPCKFCVVCRRFFRFPRGHV